MHLKGSRFILCPKGMRNLHRNTKESYSRIFGITGAGGGSVRRGACRTMKKPARRLPAGGSKVWEIKVEATAGLEPAYTDLQSAA